MKCPQCDAEIDSQGAFCPKCGERLHGLEAECFAELREPAEAVGAASSVGPQEPAVAASHVPAAVGPGHAATPPTARHAFSGTRLRLFLVVSLTLAILFAMAWWPWTRRAWPVAAAAVTLLGIYPLWVYVAHRRRARAVPSERTPNGS